MPKIKMRVWLLVIFFVLSIISSALADGECGSLNNGSVCANGMCCSKVGYCGTTAAYCCDGCQSQCDPSVCAPPPPLAPCPPSPPSVPTPPAPADGGIKNLISKEMFDNFLIHKDDPSCHAVGFYTYEAFIEAADFFPEFGNDGDDDTRKKEIAAFLGQTSHETTGWWLDAHDGREYWGYCYKEEVDPPDNYCVTSIECPCASGKKYYGRGPIQLSYNYNYCQAGQSPAIMSDLLCDPEKVAEDALMSFKTALWFWMTEQSPKPSCHDVMVGRWEPSPADIAANRLPGYGVCTNIINGGLECGHGYDERVYDRILFYERYCNEFGVGYGDNVDCYDQKPFSLGESLISM